MYLDLLITQLAGECGTFRAGSFDILFPNGTTEVKFPINIPDDDIYEGDESFTLVIDNNLPSLVNLGTHDRATVFIRDDEKGTVHNFDHHSICDIVFITYVNLVVPHWIMNLLNVIKHI